MFLKSVLSGAASAYYLLQLRRNQWKSPQELEETQLKRLKNIVHYAYNHIPYYRRLYKSASFKPENLRSRRDLRKTPTTTKMDLRRNYSDMIAKGVDTSKYQASFTSGSTGMPLKILSNQENFNYSASVVAYCFMECGLSLGDRLVKMGGFRSSHHMPNHIPIPIPVESRQLSLTIDILRRLKPDAILVQPWMLTSLCTVDVTGIEPKLIFSRAETLSENLRNRARSKFGIEINDTYGAVEFNRMAFECNEHSGLHTITDSSVTEFLDEGEQVSPGERGEIVVTSLTNYAMPLIRYEIGDLGVPTDEACSCGRNWPLIKRVEGRTFDIFTLESGRKLYHYHLEQSLTPVLNENIFSISEYQIVQEKRNKIVIKIVEGKKFDFKIINQIKENIDNVIYGLDEDVNVEVQIVKEIPVERSGKKKFIISLLE